MTDNTRHKATVDNFVHILGLIFLVAHFADGFSPEHMARGDRGRKYHMEIHEDAVERVLALD